MNKLIKVSENVIVQRCQKNFIGFRILKTPYTTIMP